MIHETQIVAEQQLSTSAFSFVSNTIAQYAMQSNMVLPVVGPLAMAGLAAGGRALAM